MHVARENMLLIRGPAIAWNIANGIYHPDLLGIFRFLADELRVENYPHVLGTEEIEEPWAPPGSAEDFRKRLEEATKATTS
jgi:hypothetical protein